MEIRIDNLKIRPRKLVFAEPVEKFPVLRELVERGEVGFHGDISTDLVATLVGTLVEVEGSLACTVVIPCSRCLQPAEQQLDLRIALAFTRQKMSEAGTGEERELTEEEVGLIPFEGDTIDLRSSLEQELLMGLPQHPLCADDCAGLCPVCGANLNRNRCDCPPPVFNGGLSALKGFKVTKE
ncbi:MAG: DUF177 domain-containing protein [Desulfuromonadales bacterium]|nr:DUF177 domain-containing protein [Desulfuromonadales bacterium]